MKKLISVILVSFNLLLVSAQDPYASILKEIEQNSTTLAALRQQADAQKLGNKTGITPANPEVEFGYLWGSPGAVGSRKDLSVRQSFSFPAVYIHQNRLFRSQDSCAEYQYRSRRAEILHSAKTSCIELTYYNALLKLYQRQLQNAKQMAGAYDRLKKTGSANLLDYNKAVLNCVNIENEVCRISLERERLLSELTGLNGGNRVAFETADFSSPAILPADFDEWYAAAEAQTPALQYLRSQLEASSRRVRLSRASSLPKFSVGYTGEFVTDHKFQGLTLGMSVPLWENRNRVRQARSEAVASERFVEDAKVQYYNKLKAIYARASELQKNVFRYNAALEQHDNGMLLFKAYSNGEISLLNYLLELEYYFSACDKRLQAQRDLELALAELNAYLL